VTSPQAGSQIVPVDADAVALEVARARSGVGVRRRIVAARDDPQHPGSTLLVFDDGSALSLPDARRSALADSATVGRA
jgi:hypothetical protein